MSDYDFLSHVWDLASWNHREQVLTVRRRQVDKIRSADGNGVIHQHVLTGSGRGR